MFTRQHEQELAEIKGLTYELRQRFEDVLKELELVKQGQEQLAAMKEAGAGAQSAPSGKPGAPSSGGRTGAESGARAGGAGSKKPRKRQSAAAGDPRFGQGTRQAKAKGGNPGRKQVAKSRKGTAQASRGESSNARGKKGRRAGPDSSSQFDRE